MAYKRFTIREVIEFLEGHKTVVDTRANVALNLAIADLLRMERKERRKGGE